VLFGAIYQNVAPTAAFRTGAALAAAAAMAVLLVPKRDNARP
jgi:hypothetical protein